MDDKFDKPVVAPKKEVVLDAKRAFEDWATSKKVEAWKVGAAKAMCAWPIGKEVTEAEFDQAVYDACNHVIR